MVVDLDKYDCSQDCYDRYIGFWVKLITARAPNATIIVVPTHLDKFLVESDQLVISRCQHIITTLHQEQIEYRRRVSLEVQRLSIDSDRRISVAGLGDFDRSLSGHDVRPVFPNVLLFEGQVRFVSEMMILTGLLKTSYLYPLKMVESHNFMHNQRAYAQGLGFI